MGDIAAAQDEFEGTDKIGEEADVYEFELLVNIVVESFDLIGSEPMTLFIMNIIRISPIKPREVIGSNRRINPRKTQKIITRNNTNGQLTKEQGSQQD